MLGILLGVVLGLGGGVGSQAATLRFGGQEWRVRSGEGGPGPNRWEPGNVWLDGDGRLHLRIRHQGGVWSCAEVWTVERLGFGRYEFEVEGGIDRLDDQVVLGLFNYPTAEVGGDATCEIDIEFARWGNAASPIGNFTVWPVEKGLGQTTKTFGVTLKGLVSTHWFEWSPARVLFGSVEGVRSAGGRELARWTFEPAEPARRVARQPMPVHLNLWLHRGKPPKDGREVEVTVRAFRFRPE